MIQVLLSYVAPAHELSATTEGMAGRTHPRVFCLGNLQTP